MLAKTSRGTQGQGAADLFVRQAGEGEPVLLLHGLFGNGANLGALTRALQGDYHVISPDLPGHGRSPVPVHFDLPGMARVLSNWLQEEGLGRVHLVGHSLGGKVAMQMALEKPAEAASLVVADIAPVAYPARHDAVFAALDAVAAADCRSRDGAQALLEEHVVEPGVVQFLLASLWRDDSGVYRWRFDPRALRDAYPDLLAPPAQGLSFEGPVLFLKGSESDYLQSSQQGEIHARFPRAELRVIAGAGHWLHVEKPALFNSSVKRFLSRHAM